MPPAWIQASYFGFSFRRVTDSITRVMSSRKTRPPSRAGIGSMFMMARFTAMKAPRYRMSYTASEVDSALSPVSAIRSTMPTGPDMSRSPTSPWRSWPRPIQTMRPNSIAVSQL